MERVIKELKVFIDEIENMEPEPAEREVGRDEFALLLSGVAACRKAPGVPVHMGYESLYQCADEKSREELRAHLYRLYRIKDMESLKSACFDQFTSGREYEQFMTFWCGAPLFDAKELNEGSRKVFEQRKSLAKCFYPFVEEKGFYAWDINERIELCRLSLACALISRGEYDEIVDLQVKKALVFYQSFKEYAVSLVCGALYDIPENREEDMLSFLDINRNMVRHLLRKDGAWGRNKWFVPKEREWVALLPHNGGCIVSNRIAEGAEIGYMYRDEDPSAEWADTGWRFFAGDEPEEYTENADNFSIWSLNDVCNVEPQVLGYVEAEPGAAFERDGNRKWRRLHD